MRWQTIANTQGVTLILLNTIDCRCQKQFPQKLKSSCDTFERQHKHSMKNTDTAIRFTLWWRHNDHYGVSNHQPHHWLLNCLFGHRSKKTSKLRVTGLCAGNSPGTGEFPAQMASSAENVSIWWRHHEIDIRQLWMKIRTSRLKRICSALPQWWSIYSGYKQSRHSRNPDVMRHKIGHNLSKLIIIGS